MKKIVSIFILNLILSFYCFTQEIDLKKYIQKDDWILNLCYNNINKADKSFSHYLKFKWDDTRYKIFVFSSNPDITITIYDSSETKVLKKFEDYTMKDGYYFFTTDFTASKTKHKIQVKARKSDNFSYYFLATYASSGVPKSHLEIINDFMLYSKDNIFTERIKIGGKSYSKKLIGFLYFPSGQYNYRFLYKNNIFMAQSFTTDKSHSLKFYEDSKINEDKRKNVTVYDEKLPGKYSKYSSKHFISPIKPERLLHTIYLDADDPSILISYQLFEDKGDIEHEIVLTKPVPEKTDKMSINLAGYVTNWKDKPANSVVVKRINGSDITTFRLEPKIVGTVFNFDLNIPLTPGKNQIIIETIVDGKKKILEKSVIAEATKKSLLVELTWDKPATDLDLYVVKPNGEVVCFENQNENNPRLGWLDIDAKDGYGPERFRMDQPAKGKYKIYAHYYNGDAALNVFIKVITETKVKEFNGVLKNSNKTNSSPLNIGNGNDWLLLGEAEIQ